MRTFLASWLWIMGAWVGRFSGVVIKSEEAMSLYIFLIVGLTLCIVNDIAETVHK